jgi:hypothetical protein
VVHAGTEQVVVIGDRGAARAQEFDQPDARGQAQPAFVETAAPGERHGLQPRAEREVDSGRHALEQRLEEVVVRVHPARVDDAVRRIEHALALQRDEPAAHLGEHAIGDAQVGGIAARLRIGQAGEHGVRIADQEVRSHARHCFGNRPSTPCTR